MNGKLDVLIVDDESDLLEELTELFELRGCSARGVPRVRDALRELEEATERVLVICDFQLPGRSGLDFLRILAERPHLQKKVCRFIIMTGHSDLDQHADILVRDFGASVLRKPVSIQKLLPLVETTDCIDWRPEPSAAASQS